MVLCVFRHQQCILVATGRDHAGDQFYRPLGGQIEFGEFAVQALQREIREELGLEIEHTVQLGVIENHFTNGGKPCHEIMLVFDARFVDQSIYFKETIEIRETGWDGAAKWIDPQKVLPVPLYPSGLVELLQPALGPR